MIHRATVHRATGMSKAKNLNVTRVRPGCGMVTYCPGGGGVVYVQPPKTNFYMKLTQEFPNFDRARFDLGEVAKRFVQMQINAKLDGVGPPIDVLRVTKDHTCWVQHKNDCNAGVQKCSDIEPQLTPTKPAQGFPVRDNSRPAVLIIGILAVSALFVYLFVRRR